MWPLINRCFQLLSPQSFSFHIINSNLCSSPSWPNISGTLKTFGNISIVYFSRLNVINHVLWTSYYVTHSQYTSFQNIIPEEIFLTMWVSSDSVFTKKIHIVLKQQALRSETYVLKSGRCWGNWRQNLDARMIHLKCKLGVFRANSDQWIQ